MSIMCFRLCKCSCLDAGDDMHYICTHFHVFCGTIPINALVFTTTLRKYDFVLFNLKTSLDGSHTTFTTLVNGFF